METIRSILECAQRAPSGGNLQPWVVHVVGGDRLRDLRSLIASKRTSQPGGEGTEYPVYPDDLKEPYRTRRHSSGEKMYSTIGVGRGDAAGRAAQFARNFDFFGAPIALFFSVDRQMGAAQWADVGMFMQNIMLLARERGLHTCPQEAWALWHRTLQKFLHLPAQLMLFCGMALGFRDESAAINTLKTDRAPMKEFVTFVGI